MSKVLNRDVFAEIVKALSVETPTSAKTIYEGIKIEGLKITQLRSCLRILYRNGEIDIRRTFNEKNQVRGNAYFLTKR
jgi:hypothetical protein